MVEKGVTADAASLIGVGAGSITEAGLAQVRPAASAAGTPSLLSTGIASELASPSAQSDLLASETGALLPVLTLAGQGTPDAIETGRTAVTSSLSGSGALSIQGAGVKGVSALLSLAAATSTTDRAVAGEQVRSEVKGAFALGATSRATEIPSVPALTKLAMQEAAVGGESVTASGSADLVVFEVGAGVAVLSPVTVEGVSALDVIESSRSGVSATLSGAGSGTVKGRGITGDSALLQVGSDTATTETGLALAAPSVRAATALATLDPTLRADEAAAILAVAQASVLEDVPGRIAEIRAVLRDRITADARLRDSLLIDALLQD
ncbi:hypothetical protein [Salinibacter ruber]|uniref:hypothetical protein n=1 Tax=Salinibacter ruber TaxID=146919 RepID=UPI0021697D0B|nr:hypothetical protein [Salinibacter ruber]MCS3610970.1 hypothetical protein [Salinibacter ruber]